jgi:hypothetical protein
VKTGAIVYLIGHHLGAGPLSWLYLSELIPVSAVEFGLALSASCWWAFNLVFSVTFESLVSILRVFRQIFVLE